MDHSIGEAMSFVNRQKKSDQCSVENDPKAIALGGDIKVMTTILYNEDGRTLNIVGEKELHILSKKFNGEDRPLSSKCSQGPV